MTTTSPTNVVSLPSEQGTTNAPATQSQEPSTQPWQPSVVGAWWNSAQVQNEQTRADLGDIRAWWNRAQIQNEQQISTESADSSLPADATPLQTRPQDQHAAPRTKLTERRAPQPSMRVHAVVALHALARQEVQSEEQWLEAAEIFRRTFRKLRLLEPRHADLAQIVSDALRFTSREELTDMQAAMIPMEAAGDALLDSFVPTDTELQVQKELLATGWRLTRPYGGRSFSS